MVEGGACSLRTWVRSCVSSRGRSNVCHNKKFSLVSFREIDRLVYPRPPAGAIVLEVSPIAILSLFSNSLMAISWVLLSRWLWYHERIWREGKIEEKIGIRIERRFLIDVFRSRCTGLFIGICGQRSRWLWCWIWRVTIEEVFLDLGSSRCNGTARFSHGQFLAF